ncbi:F-box protein [Aspergillus mulundensis]|uniref:F-box domain-containing protein n=1 Tax=Aspergillus mulundensis TaxID=1810919 RepID=A0A3D8Q9Q6_9EURO|nr:hypothetical protein DSM5745_11273 [Aspergillus mulundensis]RDW58582.1 hypothetical protein DSM5745_11273 [Aspergillus mulundensis]
METNGLFIPPELMVQILGELPQRDLLLAQRVNRTWNELIANDKHLQEKLFFRPATTCLQPESKPDIDINPLLEEFFPPFFEHLQRTLAYGNINDRRVSVEFDDLGLEYNGIESLREQEWYKSETKRQAVLRVDASWRRMYPCNPPGRLGDLGMDLSRIDIFDGRYLIDTAYLTTKYELENHKVGAKMGLIWCTSMFILDDNPTGQFRQFRVVWFREREGYEDKSKKDSWYLYLHVDTRHRWNYDNPSWEASGFKIVDGGGLIRYRHGLPDNLRRPSEPRPRRNRY